MEWVYRLFVFVGGFGLGYVSAVLSKYHSDILTDRRREREAEVARNTEFQQLNETMPELLTEMQNDLSGSQFKREFVLVAHAGSIGISDGSCFEYYTSQHEDLSAKVMILEEKGWLTDVTESEYTPRYRMTEEFVSLLRNATPL